MEISNVTKDDFEKNHVPGQTDLAAVADKIQAERERIFEQDGMGFLMRVPMYPHESKDIEDALRAASRPEVDALSGMAMSMKNAPTIADAIRLDLDSIERDMLGGRIGCARDTLDRIRSLLPQQSPSEPK